MRSRRAGRLPLTGAALVPLGLIAFPADALQLERELRMRTQENPHAAVADPARLPQLTLRAAKSLERVPGPRLPYPRPTQPLIATLKVNAVARDERYVRMDEAGKFLLKADDVRDLVALPPGLVLFEIEGEDHVDVAALPGVKVAFDEKTLTLNLSFPPEQFPRQVYDLRNPGGPVSIVEAPTSALLNYRLGQAGVSGAGSGTLSLAADSALSYGGWLLRNQSFHSRSNGEANHLRIETQLIRDDRANLRRLILGDATIPSLPLGSGVGLAGVTWTKAYALDPAFNRQPAAAYRGLAEFPSQVDFYVGSTLVTRQQVAPGPFDIQNFSYFGGRRDVRVVVRDVFGREQTISYPFYFAAQGLAAGLHDYSYQAGWIREFASDGGAAYGPFAVSAFHHYGFSDAWTLGARMEASAKTFNAGPDILYTSSGFGTFALHLGASRNRETSVTGHAISASHSLQWGDFSSHLQWQRFKDYAVLEAGFAPRLPLGDFSASVGYSSRLLGSVSLSYTRLDLPGEPLDRSVGLNYSVPLFRGLSFSATVRRQLERDRGYEAFLNLQYLPTPTSTVSLAANRTLEGVKTYSLAASNNVPSGEGVAYGISADRQEYRDGGAIHNLSPRATWFGKHGTVSGELIHQRSSLSGDSTAYSVSLAGALVAAGRHVALTRPVVDSFAVVQVEPPLAGIRVYENSQEVARTDARGRVLLPNVTSYANNRASIQDKDIPIQYSIDRVAATFSPPARSGTYLQFDVKRLRVFTGRFMRRDGGRDLPLEYHRVLVDAGGQPLELATARNGEFYVENLPTGRHRATVDFKGRTCEFFLVVPESDADAVELGEVKTCDEK